MFLVNNLLFVLLTFTVLIGTVFPLVVEAFKGKRMSVGRPYFDSMMVPVDAALLFLIGVGPALPWGRVTKDKAIRSLLLPRISGAVAALLGYLSGVRNPWSVITLLFGGYAAWGRWWRCRAEEQECCGEAAQAEEPLDLDPADPDHARRDRDRDYDSEEAIDNPNPTTDNRSLYRTRSRAAESRLIAWA